MKGLNQGKVYIYIYVYIYFFSFQICVFYSVPRKDKSVDDPFIILNEQQEYHGVNVEILSLELL